MSEMACSLFELKANVSECVKSMNDKRVGLLSLEVESKCFKRPCDTSVMVDSSLVTCVFGRNILIRSVPRFECEQCGVGKDHQRLGVQRTLVFEKMLQVQHTLIFPQKSSAENAVNPTNAGNPTNARSPAKQLE